MYIGKQIYFLPNYALCKTDRFRDNKSKKTRGLVNTF